MTERRVAEVMPERDGFSQVLVQVEGAGDRACDLRYLQRVCQARAHVVAGRREKDLGLVLEPPKRLRVDDAVAVALKGGAQRIWRF